MSPMAAVPAVHEEVHQRTGEHESEREEAQEMCAVLGQQEERGDRRERDEDPSPAPNDRIDGAILRAVIVTAGGMIVVCHGISPGTSESVARTGR